MKTIYLLIAAMLLTSCSGIFPSSEPTQTPAPTSVPVTAPTVQPTAIPSTATPLPSPTATVPVPVLGLTGEVYVTRIDRTVPDKPSLQIERVPAGCLEVIQTCPTPPTPVEGYTDPTSTAWSLAWSPDGKFAAVVAPAVQGSPAQVMRYDPADGSWKSLASFDYIAPELVWSPDSQLLAFLAQNKNKSEIYTIHPDGSSLTPMTKGFLAILKNPVLAGWVNKYITFTGTEPDNMLRIYGIRSGYPKPSRYSNVELFRGMEGGHPPSIPSPDGSWATYAEYDELTGMSVGVVSLTHESASHFLYSIKDGEIQGYAWSPKGDWLSFWVQTADSAQIFVVHPDGSDLQSVYEGETIYSAVFSPETNALLVETGSKDSHKLVLVPINGGEPKTVLDGGAAVSWEGPSWRP
jgi:WD40 repeat protein